MASLFFSLFPPLRRTCQLVSAADQPSSALVRQLLRLCVCPLRRPDNDTLARQIAGLPSAWNCKHSGEGSLGHSRKTLNWEFLEELLVCLHSSSGTAAAQTAPPVITALYRTRFTQGAMRLGRCAAFLCKQTAVPAALLKVSSSFWIHSDP